MKKEVCVCMSRFELVWECFCVCVLGGWGGGGLWVLQPHRLKGDANAWLYEAGQRKNNWSNHPA